MADPITFVTRLTDAEWDETIGGWHCPVLKVPGATIDGLYVAGSQIDNGKFQVLQSQQIIRWMLTDRPERVAAVVKLTKELALESETDKWKKRAIILPFLATILSAVITSGTTYLVKKSEPQTPARSDSLTSPVELPAPPSGSSQPNINTSESWRFAIFYCRPESGNTQLARIYADRIANTIRSRGKIGEVLVRDTPIQPWPQGPSYRLFYEFEISVRPEREALAEALKPILDTVIQDSGKSFQEVPVTTSFPNYISIIVCPDLKQ